VKQPPLRTTLKQREKLIAGVPDWTDVTPPQYRLIASMGAPCLELPAVVSKRGFTQRKARWLAPLGVVEIVGCCPALSWQLAPLEVRKTLSR